MHALAGAWAFIQLELPAEEQRYALKKVRAADVEDAYNYMSSLFWHYQGKNMSFAQWDRQVLSQLYRLCILFSRQSDSSFNLMTQKR